MSVIILEKISATPADKIAVLLHPSWTVSVNVSVTTYLSVGKKKSVRERERQGGEKKKIASASHRNFSPPMRHLRLPSWNIPLEPATNPIILGGPRVSVVLLDHINVTLIGADRPAEP